MFFVGASVVRMCCFVLRCANQRHTHYITVLNAKYGLLFKWYDSLLQYQVFADSIRNRDAFYAKISWKHFYIHFARNTKAQGIGKGIKLEVIMTVIKLMSVIFIVV